MNAEIKEIIDYISLECNEEWGKQLENYILDLEQSLVQSAKNTSKAMELAEACKSRCEEAIEYIEERKNLNWYADGVFVDELLNILNGGEKDDH